jgi:hypothetical protein
VALAAELVAYPSGLRASTSYQYLVFSPDTVLSEYVVVPADTLAMPV